MRGRRHGPINRAARRKRRRRPTRRYAAIRPRLRELDLQVDPERVSMLESERLTGPTRLPVVVIASTAGTGQDEARGASQMGQSNS